MLLVGSSSQRQRQQKYALLLTWPGRSRKKKRICALRINKNRRKNRGRLHTHTHWDTQKGLRGWAPIHLFPTPPASVCIKGSHCRRCPAHKMVKVQQAMDFVKGSNETDFQMGLQKALSSRKIWKSFSHFCPHPINTFQLFHKSRCIRNK